MVKITMALLQCSLRIHLDNANGFAAVFLPEMQGPSTLSGSTFATVSHDKSQKSCLFMNIKVIVLR